NYLAANSGCEPFSVQTSAIVTTVYTGTHGGSESAVTAPLTLGAVVHDHATVSTSGAPIPAGSSVTFKLYMGPFTADDCTTGSTVSTQSVAISGPTAQTVASSDSAALGAGDYAYRATFASGDTGVVPDASGTCEPFSVLQVTPAFSTTASSTGFPALIKDTAHLTGASALAGGMITFDLYGPADATCAGPAVDHETVTVSGSGDYTTPIGFTVSAPGTYSWIASYSGDADNAAAGPTACDDENETTLISAETSDVETTVYTPGHGDGETPVITALTLGSVVHDHAIVTADAGTPTGTATFTLKQGVVGGDCVTTGTVVSTETVALVGGLAQSSDSAPLGAGSYAYRVHFHSNDALFADADSLCEPFSVAKSQLTLESKVHDADHNVVTSVLLGAIVHDTAKLSGGVVAGFTPPAITFQFFQNNRCTNGSAVANIGADEGDPSRDRSAASAPLVAGAYAYEAFIAGDANYLAANSGCEPFSVGQTTPGFSTTASSAGFPAVINDTAHLTGASVSPVAGGTITFNLYGPDDANCTGTAAYTQTVSVSGSGDYHTAPGFTVVDPGTYTWIAIYSGDANNAPAGPSACNDANETIVVASETTDTETTVNDSAHDGIDITNQTVALGTIVHDHATVTDGGQTPTGSATFTLYVGPFVNGDCTTGMVVGSPQMVTLVNGTARSNDTDPLGAGHYGYVVHYTSDNALFDNGNAQCEPFDVAKAPTTTTTVVVTVHVTSVHDQATVTRQVDGVVIGGTVTFHLYHGLDCAGAEIGTAETIAVGIESTPHTLTEGDYSYRAVYNGDANYKGSTADCEPFSVEGTPPTTSDVLVVRDEDRGPLPIILVLMAIAAGAIAFFGPLRKRPDR
ncbi:MAG: hypothetical protein ACRDF7_08770, partial [Candidatus Limnocylindrales bacterium]